jgi:signal transduction histidine kinase/CheY-like chemotaxis protein
MQNETTETLIASLAKTAIEVSPNTIVEEVKHLLADKPPTASVVVVNGRKPIGLMTNYHLNRLLGDRYGVSLYYHRKVKKIMNPNPLIVNDGELLENVAEVAMNRDSASLYDDIIVTRNGNVAGTVPIKDILEALVRIHMKAKENAEASAKAKSDFLANMSHEIRTPINAITGLTELALKTDLNRKQKDYLKKINFSTQSLLGIINDILDLSKIEAGRLELESTEFVLSEVMDNLVDMFTSKMSEKGIEMVVAIEENVPHHLKGDPFRLGQVLINLISNALKFTHEGEIVIKASLVKTLPGRVGLMFKVKDTGIGISDEKAEKLFTPFTQADSSTTRRYGGTGLGLTICKRLVEAMHGRIGVKSWLGQGSLFYFTARFDLPEKTTSKPLAFPVELSGIRSLVVDDNEEARCIISQVLSSFGFDVQSIDSGPKALQLMNKTTRDFDLVILDWKMPEMDGITTLRSIRNTSSQPDLPVIFMTAFGRDEIIQEAQTAGANAFLTKPVKQSVLFDTIIGIFGKEAALPKKPETSSETDAFTKLAGSRLLVVDDNPINLQVAQELLENMQITVETACTGKEAVKAVGSKYFDAVLMDVQMPEMDGFEATRRIRQLESKKQNLKTKADSIGQRSSLQNSKRLPIIAVTAAAMKEDRNNCLWAGMDDYISKPIDSQKLYHVLTRWIHPSSQNAIPISSIETENTEQITRLPNDLPGIDIKSCLDRFLGNTEKLKNLLSSFMEQHAQTVLKISTEIQEGNPHEAASVVHNLKGVASIFSAENLSKAAADLEFEIKQEGNGQIERRLDVLEKELNQVLNSAQQLIEIT